MVALPSHTAGAATTTTLVVAPTSASPGDDVSISVNFDQTSDDGELVFVELITSGLTTGSATFGTPTTTGLICEPTETTIVIRCVYDGTTSGTVQVTATLSGTATPGDSFIVEAGSAPPIVAERQTVNVVAAPTYTATFGAQSPTPAPPSSTLASSVTFTRTGASTTNIGVDLEGTGGEGTLSNFVINAGGTCLVTTNGRGFRCDWVLADPDTVTITFDVNVGAGATPPDWTLRAILDEGVSGTTLATRSVVIEPPATTSTVPVTTAAPTTAAPTTTSPTTAVPVDELPATGPSTATSIAIIGALLLAGGLIVTGIARHRTS